MTKELISEINQLKRDLAFKREELQAMYIEHKGLSRKIDALEKENHSFKQQIKQLEEEQEDLLNYPWLYLEKLKAIGKQQNFITDENGFVL